MQFASQGFNMRNAVLIYIRKSEFYLNINKRQKCAFTKSKKKVLKLLMFYTVNLNLNKENFQCVQLTNIFQYSA